LIQHYIPQMQKKFITRIKTRFVNKLKMLKTLNKKTLFAKLFGPIEKLLIKQYRTCQCGKRSTKLFYCSLVTAKTPNIANTKMNVSMNRQLSAFCSLQLHKK